MFPWLRSPLFDFLCKRLGNIEGSYLDCLPFTYTNFSGSLARALLALWRGIGLGLFLFGGRMCSAALSLSLSAVAIGGGGIG